MLSAAENAPSASKARQSDPSREPLHQPEVPDSDQHEEASDESSALRPAEEAQSPDGSTGDSADQDAVEVSMSPC